MRNQNLEKQGIQFADGLARKMERWAISLAQFIETELSLGMAFAEASHQHRSRGRHREAAEEACRAKEALDQARKFMSDAEFTDQKKQSFKEKMLELQHLLETI